MAFEQIYTYVDRLVELHKKAGEKHNYGVCAAYLDALTNYYETVCQVGKFKSQKQYCKNKIIELNPAYARGYFKLK